MFDGYDSERRPPYTQEILKVVNGKLYKITYYVSNAYGGGRSISSGPMELIEENYEESSNRKQC